MNSNMIRVILPFHRLHSPRCRLIDKCGNFCRSVVTSASSERRRIMIFGMTTLAFTLVNVMFVLFVQAFEKVPALKAMAPTQSEPPFLVAQLVVLALFIALTILALKRFRVEPVHAIRAGAGN